MLTILVEREDDLYFALIPSLNIASQGETVLVALANLKEAFELYFEGESKEFIEKKMKAAS